jgi:hypothetical protein
MLRASWVAWSDLIDANGFSPEGIFRMTGEASAVDHLIASELLLVNIHCIAGFARTHEH